jgi:hypothetical protein
MGRNSKRNKAITKMYLPRLKKYCEELEKQLEALKTDPNTTLGQVINQARELYTQNSRLSVLTAALLEAQGNKVTVSKAAMDKFENHRVLIKWELPEGVEKAEDAKEFVFMYEAVKNQTPMQPIQVGPMTHASVPITEAAITGTAPLAVDDPSVVLVEGSTDAVDPEIAGELTEGEEDSAEPTELDAAEDQGDIISSAMAGVDCPYCEDGTEHVHDGVTYNPNPAPDDNPEFDCPYCEDTTDHKHSEEDVAHLRAALD